MDKKTKKLLLELLTNAYKEKCVEHARGLISEEELFKYSKAITEFNTKIELQ